MKTVLYRKHTVLYRKHEISPRYRSVGNKIFHNDMFDKVNTLMSQKFLLRVSLCGTCAKEESGWKLVKPRHYFHNL